MLVNLEIKLQYRNTQDEFGFTISEDTVRNFKRTYLERLKSTPDPDAITSLPHASLGRPLLIRCYDEDVYDYIKRYVNECDVLMDVKTLTFLDINMYTWFKNVSMKTLIFWAPTFLSLQYIHVFPGIHIHDTKSSIISAPSHGICYSNKIMHKLKIEWVHVCVCVLMLNDW